MLKICNRQQFAANTSAELYVGVMTSSQLTNASESINITFPVVFISKQIHEIRLYFTDEPNYEEIVSCFSAWCDVCCIIGFESAVSYAGKLYIRFNK